MKNLLILACLLTTGQAVLAQRIVEIKFNLYTDSLIKGFHNYISVDGKLQDGRWYPLTEKEIVFTVSAGVMEGNEILIDSSEAVDSVVVKAALRNQPAVWKQAVIYLRKRGFDTPLKTEEEILAEMQNSRKKKQ